MQRTEIEAPASLLISPKLSASAKVVWLAASLIAPQRALPLLERGAGLSRPTVRKGIAELTASGWYSESAGAQCSGNAAPGGRWATIPAKLLADRKAGPLAKVLYGLLQTPPQYQDMAGQFTHTRLGDLTGMSLNTIRRAVGELVQCGWLKTQQKHHLSPIRFELSDPDASRQEAEVDLARQRLKNAAFGGEAIMRAWLTLLVDSDQYEDNASPKYLVNPLTEERLQFDRYYPDQVAFEFQGPQHFGPTDLYTEYAKQRARDLIKRGLCSENGVTLITVLAEDLSLKGIKAKVGDLLPLRSLAEHQQLVAYLAGRSKRYRLKARRAAQHQAGATTAE